MKLYFEVAFSLAFPCSLLKFPVFTTFRTVPPNTEVFRPIYDHAGSARSTVIQKENKG